MSATPRAAGMGRPAISATRRVPCTPHVVCPVVSIHRVGHSTDVTDTCTAGKVQLVQRYGVSFKGVELAGSTSTATCTSVCVCVTHRTLHLSFFEAGLLWAIPNGLKPHHPSKGMSTEGTFVAIQPRQLCI